jgi:hypothetical protein
MENIKEIFISTSKDIICEKISKSNIDNDKKIIMLDYILNESKDKEIIDMVFKKGSYVQKKDKNITGIALAIIYIGMAYILYKRFLSKAARSCKGSANKSECMKNFRNTAIKKQISALQSSLPNCSKSKEPRQCEYKIKARIKKLEGIIK